MKRTYKTISAAVVAVFLIAAVVYAGVQSETFYLTNNAEPLGVVTINIEGGGTVLMGVSSTGQFDTEIPYNASGISINNQTVAVSTPGTITLPNSHVVNISWPSGRIVIVDQNEL